MAACSSSERTTQRLTRSAASLSPLMAIHYAHLAMLAAQGIISEGERDELLKALDDVEHELDAGGFAFQPGDEDIHMAIERRVTELAGSVGGKLHTARSRNDQVATDVALFVRAHALGTAERVTSLMATLADQAEAHLDWPMPGYTHLQRAQPVYLSHHLLAYFWMLERDRERLRFAAAQADRHISDGAMHFHPEPPIGQSS